VNMDEVTLDGVQPMLVEANSFWVRKYANRRAKHPPTSRSSDRFCGRLVADDTPCGWSRHLQGDGTGGKQGHGGIPRRSHRLRIPLNK